MKVHGYLKLSGRSACVILETDAHIQPVLTLWQLCSHSNKMPGAESDTCDECQKLLLKRTNRCNRGRHL